MSVKASELARILSGTLDGEDVALTGFAPADSAQAGHVTFAENEAYLSRASGSAASAVIVPEPAACPGKTLIRVTNPRVAFALALEVFFPEAKPAPGIHPSAVVAATAQVDPSAHIGPHCVVGERVTLGAGVVLLAGNTIGDDCVIGRDSRLFANATLYPRTTLGERVRVHAGAVLGSDGYGYVFDHGAHRKVPQVGTVVVGNDVEIGANVTIDRGALGPTVIGDGTKIDNLVQLGHNVVLGKHCLLVSQVGIAGSTRVGDYTTMAGQVGVAGHLNIGSQVTLAAKSGLMHNIPDGEKWMGIPAAPISETKRRLIAIQRLPELVRRLKELEREVEQLKAANVSQG
ncbi:MAG: UDP-3-O-(3-hydroxymyristoyl)glucosamine N-acyltransferase [Verrucomicrobiales bacterium]|nr:UDP-3-O-(3-hydroxymyristoyl)glucosamine N-acyltransferase [Verrucomicrobiales bacterium]